MIQSQVSAAGAVVYWSAGPTQRELIAERMRQLGLEGFIPPQRTSSAALKDALKAYAASRSEKRKGRDKLVQAHKQQSKHGFELVDVERNEDRNYYTHDFSVRVDEFGSVNVLNGYADRSELQKLFDEHQSILTGSSVGQALVRLMAHLNGVSLRQSGGIYWLPEDSVDRWLAVARAVEEAGEGETNKVYLLRTAMDENTVRAVRDAVCGEVLGSAKPLAEEIASGTLGEGALETRKTAAMELHKRIGVYEEILGEALKSLHDAVSCVERSAVLAALQTA